MDLDDDSNNMIINENQEMYEYIDRKFKNIYQFYRNEFSNNQFKVSSLKDSGNFQEELFDKKIKNIYKVIEDLEKKKNDLQMSTTAINEPAIISEIKSKLNDIENRTRRNNLQIDGVKEEPNEDWDISKNKINEILKKNLGLNSEYIVIERAHRVGKKKEDDKVRCIVAK